MQWQIEARERVNKFRQIRSLVCKPRRRLFHHQQRQRDCLLFADDECSNLSSTRSAVEVIDKSWKFTNTLSNYYLKFATALLHPVTSGRGFWLQAVGLWAVLLLSLQGCCKHATAAVGCYAADAHRHRLAETEGTFTPRGALRCGIVRHVASISQSRDVFNVA